MLTDFKNDLFATHVDMGSALIYVNTLYSGTSTPHDSLVMRTAVHIVINTAIEMHRAEKQVLVDKINELSARKDPVTALLTLVREQVNLAVAEQSHAVTAAVDEQIENWMADNLQDHVNECYDMEEKIAEQISEYFNSNTFSISSN
jgi:hypothetical protein